MSIYLDISRKNFLFPKILLLFIIGIEQICDMYVQRGCNDFKFIECG